MRLTLILAVAILAGCAAQPEKPKAAEPAAAPAPAAKAAPAATATPAATTAQAAPGAYKPPAGYKAKKLGANTLYCKKDTVLGSRFPTEICMTEDELKEMERTNEGMRQNKQKMQGMCGGVAQACGNGT